MKPGDTLFQPKPWYSTETTPPPPPRTGTIEKVGRVWAQTTLGRVRIAPSRDGSHECETGAVYTSMHDVHVRNWKNQAERRIRRALDRHLTIEQVTQLLAIVAPDFEPMPKETP